MNKWITYVFKIGSQASEGAAAKDLTWLYGILATSLENGLAQAIKDIEE